MRFAHMAFLNKKFMGLSIDFDTYTTQCGFETLWTSQITILYFRYWVNCYKRNKLQNEN